MKNILFSCKCALLLLFSGFFCLGCKRLVTVDPPITSLNDKLIFATDADATSVLTNLYINMSQSDILGGNYFTSLTLYSGLSADELALFPGNSDPVLMAFAKNDLSTNIPGLPNYWTTAYNSIYIANLALEQLPASETLTPSVKSQLMGEAYFMRAFHYFYLVNIYGDVPLNIATDYLENAKRARTPKSQVYAQIISDLKKAEGLLRTEYVNSRHAPTNERVRPNKYAASALLARAYLYVGDYANAEASADNVIADSDYKLENINDVFLKGSRETIWSLQPVYSSFGKFEAVLFRPNSADIGTPIERFPVYLRSELVDLFSANDKRRTDWIDVVDMFGSPYYFANKYKDDNTDVEASEYPIVLRLAETYLIRAEARARQGKLSGENSASSDLNIIRSRAGLSDTHAFSSEDAMLTAILAERQLELFAEWGHRWLDLKRTGKADDVLSRLKGGNWKSSDQLYLIPQEEIDGNPSLRGNQNPQ